VIARAVEAEGGQRVHRRLDLRDAALGGVDQLERRDLAAPEPLHGLRRGQADQVIGGHRAHS